MASWHEPRLDNLMDYTLLPATPEHLRAVIGWITSADELRLWGGHLLTYPPEVERTWCEIGADGGNTFTLLDASGNPSGFGQVLAREPAVAHLGRIIVSPALRGQGVGRILCEQLIAAALKQHQPDTITLNVYQRNTAAVALYRSLGFTVTAEDAEHTSYTMSLRIDPR